jgi:hypothetical protein
MRAQAGKGTSEAKKRRRGGRALRSSASRNGPFGLCQAEAFGNFIADSVSFRFPSWHSLDGRPVPPANCAQGAATPQRKSAATRKIERFALFSILLRGGASTVIDAWWEENVSVRFLVD